MNKKWIGIGGAALAVILVSVMVKASQQPMAVEVSEVKTGSMEQYVEEIGEVALNERLGLYTAAAGLVTDVNVSVGDAVKKGQLLAQLDYQSAQLQKQDLEAQAKAVAAQYQEAKKPVKAADLSKLNAQLKSAQSLYDEAVRNAADSKALYEAGALAESGYRAVMVDLANKEASLQSAKASLSSAKEGLSKNIGAQYEAQLTEIRSRIALMDKQLKDLGITAPADGIVLTKSVEKGQYVQPGKLLFEVGSGDQLHLRSDLLFEDLAGIKEGTLVKVENEDLGIKDLMGKVVKIYPTAFTKVSDLGINQKRVTVEIELSGDLSALRPGYEMTAKLIVDKRDNAVLVDKKALFEYDGKDSVFVVEKGKAQIRAVETGLENTDVFEIISGLKAGETVILSPDETLEEGMSVKAE